jgi:hypothetical protein
MNHFKFLSLLLFAMTLFVATRADAGDIASDAVQDAINAAKFKAGPPMPDTSSGPPKKQKKKREVKKKTSTKKKSSKDWSKINVDEMGQDWEDGDDEDELEHEFERIQRIAGEKAARASKVIKSGDKKKIKK